MKKNIFIAFILIFSGCKKYPDGPLISLYTKEHRIVNEWAVEQFSINGNDSTEYLQSQPLFGTYIFSKPREGHPGEFVYNSNGNKGADTSRYYSAAGSWEFADNKEFIKISSHSHQLGKHFSIGAFAADKVTWRIMRLKENELWLKTTYTDGREYFIRFKTKAA